MSADLAACFASHLRVSESSQDADMEVASTSSETSDSDTDISMDDATEGPYEIRFPGRNPRHEGVPMRLLIDNPFNTPFMRDDAADEPVALFECYRREHITLAFELCGEADTDLIRIKDSTSEPVTVRALAEDIARCYLEFMRQRSGDLDSKNPALCGVSFQQLHLVALHSTDGVNWAAETQ
ncbi:hypothetical protein FOMPIDRAFT_1017869 [Fomitopsis schrenkii]|uniref:Uncharacterized protein n=1 Tax=Fomitopsis schrenkii TaxID=2126942 RepID=S8E430_FOMSC|nr:hypothetical protein FOMPIDRAFT_1017869 [Fomitopsis schrenkii]